MGAAELYPPAASGRASLIMRASSVPDSGMPRRTIPRPSRRYVCEGGLEICLRVRRPRPNLQAFEVVVEHYVEEPRAVEREVEAGALLVEIEQALAELAASALPALPPLLREAARLARRTSSLLSKFL